MTREDIIRMAQECWPSDRRMWAVDADLPRLERFAQLVAAAEREACARICEIQSWDGPLAADDIAEAIRARGEK